MATLSTTHSPHLSMQAYTQETHSDMGLRMRLQLAPDLPITAQKRPCCCETPE